MDCFRCGSTVPTGQRSCPACGQRFGTAASASAAAGRAGHSLARRFRLRRVLGEGPVGSVYAARDETRKVDVAVKMVRTELAPTEADRNAFVVAMGRVNAIEHANVLPVLECGVDGERCWIVSPLLVGLSLRKMANMRRGKRERFVLEEVVPILAQIVDALVGGGPLGPHGDLKPENVVLLPERLVVTDFGLAHAFSGEGFSRAQRVSPLARAYRAPEIEAGGRPTIQSDVYSLGVIATELLAGRPATDKPVDFAAAVLPAEAGPVLARAVAEDPDERPDSPESFLAELAAVESGGPLKDSTTVRRRLSEVTQQIALSEIEIVRADDTEEVEIPPPDVDRPSRPREVTEKISMDMIVPEQTPTKKSALPMPVLAAPVVTAVPGAVDKPPPSSGLVAGVTGGARPPATPKLRAESTDKWVAQPPTIVLFDDSADTALRQPKEDTAPFPRLPAPTPAAPKRSSAGWLLFAGAAIAGLLLGAGFYWSQHRTPPPPVPVIAK
jgi:serine/threonine-protein kinase